MKLTLTEKEIQRALEVYINTIYAKNTKVLGFDLSGMRAASGLVAAVEIAVEGESVDDTQRLLTEPAVPYIQQTKPEPKAENSYIDFTPKDFEDWKTFLELITDNAQNKNKQTIFNLMENVSELVLNQIRNNTLFGEMMRNLAEEEKVISEPAVEAPESIVEPLSGEIDTREYQLKSDTPEDVTVDIIVDEEEAKIDDTVMTNSEPSEPVVKSTNLFGKLVTTSKSTEISHKPTNKLFK